MENFKPFDVIRPWGKFRQFCSNVVASVKIHDILPDGTSSLQSHTMRTEFWYIIQGSGTVIIGDKEQPAKVGDEFLIPVGTKHHWVGGKEGMKLLEIMTGKFEEGDEVRYEDKYGRA